MKGTLKDAIQYASQNPTSDFANQLASMVKTGQFDEDAKGLGIDLTPIKSSSLGGPAPAPTVVPEAQRPNLIQRGFDALRDNVAVPLAQAEINTVKALGQRGKNVLEDAKKTGVDIANEPTVIGKLAEVGQLGGQFAGQVAGGVGDILTNMIGPFIPKRVKEVYSAETARAIEDIKKAWNEVPTDPDAKRGYDLVHDFFGRISEKAKENPEVARAVEDAISVSLLGGAGTAETAVKPAIESTVKTAVDATGKVIKQGVEAAKTAETKTLGYFAKYSAEQEAKKIAESGAKNFKEALEISRPNAQLVEKAAIAEKRIVPGSQGLIKGADVAPSVVETRIAEAVQPLIESGEITAKMASKDPAAVQQIIDRRVSQINLGLDNMAAENNIAFTKQFNPKLYLDKAKEASQTVFAGDKALERAYDAAVTRFNQLIKTKDIQGVIKARKAFDAEMRSKYPNVFKPDIFGNMSPRDSAIKNAIFDVRDSANQFISDALPANNPYKALLKQESYLLRASENIGTKMKGITTGGKAEQFLDSKTGKILKKGLIGVGVTGGVIGGGEALLQ